jgi:hypothetical protein
VNCARASADDDGRPQFTRKQLFREEIESPFRKPRQVIAGFSAFSASVAGFISGTRALSCTMGAACLQPMDELVGNLAVNFGIICLSAFSLYLDSVSQRSKLNRIVRGGELAVLQLSSVGAGQTRNLAMRDLRGERRVVIVAGGRTVYERVVSSASAHTAELAAGSVMVVPILLREGALGASDKLVDPSGCVSGVIASEVFATMTAADCFLCARGPEAWNLWLTAEVATAIKQGFDVQNNGITLTIKKSGKIGKRATGVPSWPELVETLAVIDANFGMPTF